MINDRNLPFLPTKQCKLLSITNTIEKATWIRSTAGCVFSAAQSAMMRDLCRATYLVTARPAAVSVEAAGVRGQPGRAAGAPPPRPTKPFWGTHETGRKQRRGTPSPKIRRRLTRREAPMNHSMHSADRATHLKIVVLALVAGIAVAGLAISARTTSYSSQTAHVLKAGKPMTVTSSDTSLVR